MSQLTRALEGIDTVALPHEVREAAKAHLERWWTRPEFSAWRPALEALTDQGAFDELVDAFRQVLPFGTGGRRGLVGAGPNRLNPYTVASSVQGHVAWLRARFPQEAQLRVVVAYDVRRFLDAGARYGEVDHPAKGLSSRDLAELAARVYVANGVEVSLLPRSASYFLSTPELSLTVRSLQAHGGLNVSASHNPPDDNGVKVYDRRGAQLIPPEDERLLEQVAAVQEVRSMSWDQAQESGRVRWLEPAQHQAYIHTVAGLAPPGPRGIELLYTPLHGTGCVHQVLRAAGFRCALHGPQAQPDSQFSTVPGAVANPERPEAMAHAIASAGAAELIFGTDPDADRIGCEVLHQGAWVHLTGNDLGALIVHQALNTPSEDTRQPLVVLTEVTSTLIARLATARGAAVIHDLLVGFKFIAEVLRALEEEGSYGALRADQVRFIAGVEESHGVLVTDQIRDKDAAGGALRLAELGAASRARGRTLVDELHALQWAHGYILNGQISVRFEGATGPGRMAALLHRFRATPPTHLAGREVLSVTDHRDEGGRFGPYRSGSDRSARDVLVYQLAGLTEDSGARLILRPSGTEPKLKVYVEVLGKPHLQPAARSTVESAFSALIAAVHADLSSD